VDILYLISEFTLPINGFGGRGGIYLSINFAPIEHFL